MRSRGGANQSEQQDQSQEQYEGAVEQNQDHVPQVQIRQKTNSGMDDLVADLLKDTAYGSPRVEEVKDYDLKPKQSKKLTKNSNGKPSNQRQLLSARVSQQKGLSKKTSAQKSRQDISKQPSSFNHPKPKPSNQSNQQHHEQVNIEISVKPKAPKELLVDLSNSLSNLQDNKLDFQQSFKEGVALEQELLRLVNEDAFQIPQELQLKVEQYIRENQPIAFQPEPEKSREDWQSQELVERSEERMDAKFEEEQHQEEDHITPEQKPKTKKKQTAETTLPISPPSVEPKVPSAFAEIDAGKKELLKELLKQYEIALSVITAKNVQQIKNLNGKGCEYPLVLAFMYLFCSFDDSIVLTNDRKTVHNASWDLCKKYFSNSGNVIFNLKKLREKIEKDTIANQYLQHVLGLQEELTSDSTLNPDSPHWPFINFLEKSVELIIFIKDLYGTPIDQITPIKKRKNLMSPSSKSKKPDLMGSQSYRRRMMSPDLKSTVTDYKIKRNTDLFYQETEQLIKNAMKRDQLRNQNANVVNIQGQIQKLKFDMEKEEKKAIKTKEKLTELQELEYAKEQILLKNKVAEEQAKREKEIAVERAKQVFEETRTVKKLNKEEEKKFIEENMYDFLAERRLKEQLEAQQRQEQLNQIEYKIQTLKDKEEYEREQYVKEKESQQKLREAERKKDIKYQMTELKRKEEQLQKEIAMLQKLKEKPIKLAGEK